MNNGIFEGGFRRLPEQNLAGASKHSRKGVFLQQIHLERANRQLDIKKRRCAVKIQALIRGFLTRKRLQHNRENTLITSFTNSSYDLGLTLTELGHYLVLYYCLNTLECSDILIWLTNHVINQHKEIIKNFTHVNSSWLWKIKWLLRLHLKRINYYLDKHSSEAVPNNLSSSLHLLDLFTDPHLFCSAVGENMASVTLKEISLYLVKSNYFGASKNILEINDPQSLGIEDKSSLSVYVKELLSRPVKLLALCDADYSPTVIKELCQHFLTNRTTSEIRRIIVPMILAMDNDAMLTLMNLVIDGSVVPSTSCLFVLVEFFKKGSYFNNSQLMFCKLMESFSVLLKMNAGYCPKVIYNSYFHDEPLLDSEIIDEDEEDDDSLIDINETLSADDINVEMLEESLNYIKGIEFSMDVLSYLGTDYGAEILLHLSKFLHIVITKHVFMEFKILWYVSLHPTINRDLWIILYSMQRVVPEEKPVSLLTLLSRGIFLTSAEARAFYPTLISFCLIFKRHICMRYNDDISDSANAELPFPLARMTEISYKLRDVALSLLNIGMPDTPISVSDELQECNIASMRDSYKVIVNLLKVLHSREIGSDQSFWVSKKIFLNPTLPVFNDRSLLSKHDPFDEKTLKNRSIISSNNTAKPFILLRDLPFSIPTKDRMNLFQQLFILFKTQFQNPNEFINENMFIKIRRDYIYEDAFEKLSPSEVPEIRISVRIQLTSSMGYEEVGVDGGGIFREFMTEFLRAAFDPNRGFFLLNKDRQLYPNPNVQVLYDNFKKHYFFIGRMLAKALYENILVDLPLADCFVSSLVKRDRDVNLSDLHSLDPELYKNLISLRSYEGDFSSLGLNYTTVSDLYGHTSVTELIPGGEKISVNKANKVDYIQTVADYKLNTQIEAQCSYFRQGIASVFSIFWLAIFSAKELQRLIFCSDSPIDVEDLKNNCYYTGGYSSTHPNIIRFWNVFEKFEDSERKQLLKFVTSCCRQPLLGFKDLDPPFTIQLVESSDRLPTSSTCMNLLKLPIFQDENIMKEKLLYSIQSQAGFDLC